MTFPTFTPLKPGDDSMPVTVKPAVLSTQFGDGYVQDAVSGINSNMRSFAPKWTNATATEANYIINFLNTQGPAGKFFYTPNGESTQICVVCQDFTYAWKAGTFCDISATFKQRPPL